MRHTIYKKDGTKLCEADTVEYHGEFMGERYVLCSVCSPTPLAFETGDYMDYRGERFTASYDTGVSKNSRKASSRESFTYTDLKLRSTSDDLVNCRFLDYVKEDNLVHYSSLPTFSFFAATVGALAERIQVNLDRLYTGERAWTVEVAEDAEGKTDVNVTVERITCWEALGYVYTKFGLAFYIRGRKVTIGGTQPSLSKQFGYGKGMGLFKIESAVDSGSGIVTRLKVYGSTKNMPSRYYNNLRFAYAEVDVTSASYDTNKHSDETGDYEGQAYEVECTTDYNISCSSAPERLGTNSIVRLTGSVRVVSRIEENDDGSKTIHTQDVSEFRIDSDLDETALVEDGKPVMKELSSGRYRITNARAVFKKTGMNDYTIVLESQLAKFFKASLYDNFDRLVKDDMGQDTPQIPYDNVRQYALDEIGISESDYPTYFDFVKTAEVGTDGALTTYTGGFSDLRLLQYIFVKGYAGNITRIDVLEAPDNASIGSGFLTGNHNGSLLPNNMSVQNLMLPSFPSQTLDPYIDSDNISKYGVIEGDVFFDGSDEDLEEIFPSIEGMTAGEVMAAGISLLPPPGGTVTEDTELDAILGAGEYEGNGVYEEGDTVPTFTIYLRDMGFDLSDTFRKSSDMSIVMKSGMCNAMEFKVAGVVKSYGDDGDTLRYTLRCEREEMPGTGTYAPNESYPLASGNKFVLTGIPLPDVYIKAASQRLLEAGKEYLQSVDHPKKIYTPHVDEIEMARQRDEAVLKGEQSLHDTICEGMRFTMSDTDILGGTVSATIDTLTIKEGEGPIPTYEVTLKDEKEEGTLDLIQNQINGMTGLTQPSGQGGTVQIPIIKSADDTTPADTNVYSALRTDAEIDAAVKELMARLKEEFLKRLEPDTAQGLIKFMAGLEVGDAVDSMLAGRGILADVFGRMQLTNLEVRGSMTVMDLVINEIHAMAGDYSFTDAGAITAVEDLGNGTYRLWLRKDTDYDVTSLDVNDIVYSIINNLKLGGTDYKTSWMRVLAKNTTNNTLTVLPYPDEEVPGGTNYPPQAGYNLTRRGNTTLPETGQTNERAQAWLLSSREGRIMFLANVYKPILEDYNYALTIGKLPDIGPVKRLGVPTGAVGVMTEYLIAEKTLYFDYNGDVVPQMVERGAWSLEVAQSDKPYRNVSTSIPEAGGTTYTLLSRDVVTHVGCRWACLIDKTQLEPKWNSAGWEMIEGDTRYTMTFESSRGSAFFVGGVDTVLTARVHFGQMDITEEVMALAATEVEWARDSGNESMDRSWTPEYAEGNNSIHLTDEDMPIGFGSTVRTLAFICRVFIPVGEETLPVEGRIGISI